jgi:hypothetical protein
MMPNSFASVPHDIAITLCNFAFTMLAGVFSVLCCCCCFQNENGRALQRQKRTLVRSTILFALVVVEPRRLLVLVVPNR